MKPAILLLGLNSKATQTCPAIYSIKTNLPDKYKEQTAIGEYPVSIPEQKILWDIAAIKPEIIGFSCYIWNRELVESLAFSLKQIDADLQIVCGGPEASCDPEWFLRFSDYVICGEGESAFSNLLNKLDQGSEEKIPGVITRESLDQEYQTEDLSQLKIPEYELSPHIHYLHFEASRSCAFHCSFCLSGSLDQKVRFYSMDSVKSSLKQIFSNPEIRQIRFVDRSFNINHERTLELWRFLLKEGVGKQFHFEIAAELLTEKELEFLKQVPKEMFRFEIGVQSIHEHVLIHNGRKSCYKKLKDRILYLQNETEVIVHLDLLVGLAEQKPEDFISSFNEVFSLLSHHFQVETVKMLHGSVLRRYAIENEWKFSPVSPYGFLRNDYWSYSEVSRTEKISMLLEWTWNRDALRETIKALVSEFVSPWDFYDQLLCFLEGRIDLMIPLGLKDLFCLLHEFAESKQVKTAVQQILILDYLTQFQGGGIVPWEKLSHTLDSTHYRKLIQQNSFTKRGFVECFPEKVTYKDLDTKLFYFSGIKQESPCGLEKRDLEIIV